MSSILTVGVGVEVDILVARVVGCAGVGGVTKVGAGMGGCEVDDDPTVGVERLGRGGTVVMGVWGADGLGTWQTRTSVGTEEEEISEPPRLIRRNKSAESLPVSRIAMRKRRF